MNKNNSVSIHSNLRRQSCNLAVAAIVGVCAAAGSFAAQAQSTVGEVFGKAPVGYTVAAHSMTSGTQRAVHVDAKGRYSIRSLPVGVYTVTLEQNGRAVLKHLNVPVVVGRGIQVDLACAPEQCTEVAAKS